MEVSGQLHALTALLNRRLGWPQSRSERDCEEKNFQPLPGLEPTFILPVAQRYTAELSRFLFGGQAFNKKAVKSVFELWHS
jgi:hypothetical protein